MIQRLSEASTGPQLRIGALFAGAGGLDLAVQGVLDGSLAWVSEIDPAASKVLAHHYPDVPNHGDITKIDWAQVEPVDVLTGGFPCQDVSLAGRRAGIAEGTRSGLWSHMASAIDALHPPLVIIENVRGLLSAAADSNVEPCPWCLGDASGEPPLRALGAVLGDLADLGLDAEWVGLRAADVGACHGRYRVCVLAWPAADPERGERERQLHAGWRSGWGTAAAGRRAGSPAHPHRTVVRLEPVPIAGCGGPPVAGLAGVKRDAAADAGSPPGDLARLALPGDGPATDGRRGPSQPGGCRRAAANPDGGGLGADERHLREGQPDTDRGADADRAWGPYEPAIRSWELILGRPAPAPTEPGTKGQPRLSPRFVEWMQGFEAGWVTGVPGISRNDHLRILGNAVVQQQFGEAIRFLLDRAFGLEAAA